MTALPVGLSDRHRRPLTRLIPGSHRTAVMWDRTVESNMLVVGRTGSGKSTLLFGLALGALRVRNEVVLLDGKGAGVFAAYAGRRGVTAVEHDPMRIVERLRDLGHTVAGRYAARVAAAEQAVATQRRPDYTAPPELTVILDELITWLHDLPAGIRGEMISLLMTMTMRAREAGVRIVIATQAPNAEQREAVLPTPMRRQLGLRVLLGSEEDTARRIVLGSLADEIPVPADDDVKGLGIAMLLGGAWVPMQAYQAVNPTDERLTDRERAAAWAELPSLAAGPAAPTPAVRGAFGLVREVS